MIVGGHHVDIMLALIRFCSNSCVFADAFLLNDFFEKSKGGKRTWANPISSKQRKSLYESDDLAFRFSLAFFHVLQK